MTEYKVGGKVVAIANHPDGFFKEGDSFNIDGIENTECCNTLVLNIGIKQNGTRMLCGNCDGTHHKGNLYMWFRATWFVPFEESGPVPITYTKIIEGIPIFAN
jgi:hypothetical protein